MSIDAPKWTKVRPGFYRSGDYICERQRTGWWWVCHVSTTEPLVTGCGTLAEAKLWAEREMTR